MISYIWECSHCKNSISTINIKDDIININCVDCKSHSTKSFIEYIQNLKEKSHNNNKDTFCNISADIKKGNEHLLIYCKRIKDAHISWLTDKINEWESSYEESYNRNKDILTFYQTLITILENDINIFLCKNRTKVNDVIKYFKENNIIKKKKINIKLVKTISSPSWITSLIRLKDGRVASSSNYQKLICAVVVL